MVYEYSWENYNFPVPASIVGEECEKIEKKNGAVTANALVETARAKSSMIHELFEWDDKVAGEQWRLQQAKVVLSCLKVTMKTEDDQPPKKVRAFINTNPERSKGVYMNIEDALSNEESRAGVLIRARRELNSFLDKYSDIEELKDVIKTIKKYMAKAS